MLPYNLTPQTESTTSSLLYLWVSHLFYFTKMYNVIFWNSDKLQQCKYLLQTAQLNMEENFNIFYQKSKTFLLLMKFNF